MIIFVFNTNLLRYKFAGICDEFQEEGKESFDVFTKNVDCGKGYGGTCIGEVDVILRNMPVERHGLTTREDFHFHSKVNSNGYTVRG